MHLALLILLLSLLTNVIEWVGKSVLIELAFSSIYAPIFLRSLSTRQIKLKKQILEDKRQLVGTSSQDEFAKWAKLRRTLDKGLKDLEGLNTQIQSYHSTFSTRFSLLITLLTTGSSFFLAWWFRSRPVFWLPRGWVPSWVGWVLRFGGGPKGSVSVTVWSIVCSRTIKTFKEQLVEWIPNPLEIAFKPVSSTTKEKITNVSSEKILASPVPATSTPMTEKHPHSE